MNETKVVKGKCKKTGIYYGLTVARFGTIWKVVDVIPMTQDEARVLTSEVKQPTFETNANLLPCKRCGNRRVGGCRCSQQLHSCSPRMGYCFDCIYCHNFEPDFSRARVSPGTGATEITLAQGKKVRISFSNVKWEKYDNIQPHASPAEFWHIEPKVHVIAKDQDIEFHGYNVSEMDEGVYYTIDARDDFEIICDVDTSTVHAHPKGFLYIQMGIITAQIDQNGGAFILDGQTVARVGTRFRMALSLTEGGKYRIEIDGRLVGEKIRQSWKDIDIRFGFWHESHFCSELTAAYVRNIEMSQTPGGRQ